MQNQAGLFGEQQSLILLQAWSWMEEDPEHLGDLPQLLLQVPELSGAG